MSGYQSVSQRPSARRDDWETPQGLFDELNREFRFTLDAAASFETRKCERYLTEEEDALKADIFDQVVWCNPPYGKGLLGWVGAFVTWSLNGCTVVTLLPASTDTEWFEAAYHWADEMRLLTGRVQFVGTTSSNPGGSAVFVFRPHPPRIVYAESAATEGKITVGPFDPPRVKLWRWRDDVATTAAGGAVQ